MTNIIQDMTCSSILKAQICPPAADHIKIHPHSAFLWISSCRRVSWIHRSTEKLLIRGILQVLEILKEVVKVSGEEVSERVHHNNK